MERQIIKSLRERALTERVWFNAIWFQTTWFACVLGRDGWLPLILTLLGLHFLLVANAPAELRRIAPIALVGIAVDTLLSVGGVFDFGPGIVLPSWLVMLWLAFATTLNRSLALLGRYRWVAAVIGGIVVPANYAVGARLGAVEFPLSPAVTALALVMIWALLLPMLYQLAHHLSGREETQ